jgi:hypothetical protein
MEITALTMPPFNTTLIGVLKGVTAYYGLTHSDPLLFGASGHAFLINIHEQLCPSGPYCWKAAGFERLIGNLGLRRNDLGFFSPDSRPEDRNQVEAQLRAALDQGIPCALLNLENQLITGYDDAGFFTAQPWAPHMNFPPARLSFGAWPELGEQFHVNFYTFARCQAADLRTQVLDSLEYAVDLHRNPQQHSFPGYHIGPDAYACWKAAVSEHGASHGQWWNATVWWECRRMAAAYFTEIAGLIPAAAAPATALAHAYTEIADLLGQLRDKALPAADKIARLDRAAAVEAQAIELVAGLAAQLREMNA